MLFNVKEDDLKCIVETRSISLEYLGLQKMKKIYEDFLGHFPTTLEQDMAILRDEKQREKLTSRQYFAIIYRSEQKRILINQVKLVRITMHILERLMKGMTWEFAVLRVFELESKRDTPINRKMLEGYLKALRKGFEVNRALFLEQNNMNLDQLKSIHAEKRFVDFASKAELKRFEMTGHEQMLARILDAPMKHAEANNNTELSARLKLIKDQLFAKPVIQSGARTVKDVMAESEQKAIEETTKPRTMFDSMQDHINRMRDEVNEEEAMANPQEEGLAPEKKSKDLEEEKAASSESGSEYYEEGEEESEDE